MTKATEFKSGVSSLQCGTVSECKQEQRLILVQKLKDFDPDIHGGEVFISSLIVGGES